MSAYRRPLACCPVFPNARGREKVLKMDGAFAPRVLRFDGPCGPKGCGIAAFGGDEYILLPGAAKTVQPPFRARKMHPFCLLAATSSLEGQILAALCLELLMSAEAESRANFPPSEKSPQGNRDAFPSGEARLYGFSRRRQAAYKIYCRSNGNPQPSGQRPVKP